MSTADNPRRANKIGAFFLDRKLLENHPQACLALQAQVLIVDARSEFARDGVGYIGYSDLFDPVGAREKIPGYMIRVDSEFDPKVNREVIRSMTMERVD